MPAGKETLYEYFTYSRKVSGYLRFISSGIGSAPYFNPGNESNIKHITATVFSYIFPDVKDDPAQEGLRVFYHLPPVPIALNFFSASSQ